MRLHKAFTLLEVLIALTFSSFLVVTIARLLRHASSLFTNSSLVTEVDRRACYIINQLESDLACASATPLAQIVKAKKAEDKDEDKSKDGESKKSEAEKTNEDKEKEDKEPSKLFLSSTMETDQIIRKGKKRLQLFKDLNFITTNNILVPNKTSIKPVRVLYSLSLDKEKSKGGKTSYKLIRKETSDLDNIKFSKDRDLFDKKQIMQTEYLIADNIKSLYIEYYAQIKEEKDKKSNSKTPPPMKTIRSFEWGNKKETKNILPFYVTIRLELWDQPKLKEYQYDTRLICFAYKENADEYKKRQKQEHKMPARQKTDKDNEGPKEEGDENKPNVGPEQPPKS